MTHMTMRAYGCGGDPARALALGAAWWVTFAGALLAAWTYWPDAREALAHGLMWIGVGL